MHPASLILAFAALVAALPMDAATGAVTQVDHLDALIEKAWQNDVVGQDFNDMEDRGRRRLKGFIKKLIKSEVKKAIGRAKPSGGTGGDKGGKPSDGSDGGKPADGDSGSKPTDGGDPPGGGDPGAGDNGSTTPGSGTPAAPACPSA